MLNFEEWKELFSQKQLHKKWRISFGIIFDDGNEHSLSEFKALATSISPDIVAQSPRCPHKSSGNDMEWEHKVRSVLNTLYSMGVAHSVRHGYWKGVVDNNEYNIIDELLPHNDDDFYSFDEGKRKVITHYQYERNRKAIKLFKQGKKDENNGRLDCDICGFSFQDKYGPIGADVIDVHHVIPFSSTSASRITLIHDLAAVCSNCHRIIHSKNPPYEVNEIKELLS